MLLPAKLKQTVKIGDRQMPKDLIVLVKTHPSYDGKDGSTYELAEDGEAKTLLDEQDITILPWSICEWR